MKDSKSKKKKKRWVKPKIETTETQANLWTPTCHGKSLGCGGGIDS